MKRFPEFSTIHIATEQTRTRRIAKQRRKTHELRSSFIPRANSSKRSGNKCPRWQPKIRNVAENNSGLSPEPNSLAISFSPFFFRSFFVSLFHPVAKARAAGPLWDLRRAWNWENAKEANAVVYGARGMRIWSGWVRLLRLRLQSGARRGETRSVERMVARGPPGWHTPFRRRRIKHHCSIKHHTLDGDWGWEVSDSVHGRCFLAPAASFPAAFVVAACGPRDPSQRALPRFRRSTLWIAFYWKRKSTLRRRQTDVRVAASKRSPRFSSVARERVSWWNFLWILSTN